LSNGNKEATQQTINSKLSIKKMEVHHHPKVEKKNFKEYLLEGLMIFIAVTLGFFAESFHESINNHEMEKTYIESMIADLKADTATFSMTEKNFTYISRVIDTMLIYLKSGKPDSFALNKIISENFWNYAAYSYNNETIRQLNNSGNFRLIRNPAVVDSILTYDNEVTGFLVTPYNDLKSTMYAYKELEARVVPYAELKVDSAYINSADLKNTDKPTFISQDKELLALYYNKLFIHKALCQLFLNNLQSQKLEAIRLIDFIKKEYRLK
jgi:hypothetical protein